MIWFHPLYFLNLKTIVGNRFLRLLDGHFPRTHKFHKISNQNTIKISYCCMKYLDYIISIHNKQLSKPSMESYSCNCIIVVSYITSSSHLTSFRTLRPQTMQMNNENDIYAYLKLHSKKGTVIV